jgi:hypothetical protein
VLRSKTKGGYLSVRSRTSGSAENLTFLRGLVGAAKLKTVMGMTFLPSEVAQARRYAEAGHSKGSAVIVVDHRCPER